MPIRTTSATWDPDKAPLSTSTKGGLVIAAAKNGPEDRNALIYVPWKHVERFLDQARLLTANPPQTDEGLLPQ